MRSGVVHAHMEWVREALAWWAALLLIYLSLLSSATAVEAVVGAGVAALGGVLAVRTRQAEWAIFRFRLQWVKWLPALLADLVADTATLAVVVADAVRGLPAEEARLHRLRLAPESRTHIVRTRRATLTILLSLTPGAYVMDTCAGENGADELVVHRLGRHSRLATEVER